MKKKILLGLATVAVVIAGVALTSAFEAHIINVTAQIENGLTVTPDEIMFGTVFPQEHLFRNLQIGLSKSFIGEERADDVNYVIKQKPKCVDKAGIYVPVDPETHICPVDTTAMPSLCEYLSKTPEKEEGDISVPAFHNIEAIAYGRLAKSEGDEVDEWIIDLAVPCFEGHCDQGYAAWVRSINGQADPWAFVLPAELEHEVFGCDLWVEVTGVSRNYIDKVDFGDPDSESWHLDMVADDWSYIGSLSCTDPSRCLQIGGYGGYDGGSADFRGLMGPPTGCQATDPSHAAATFKMDIGPTAGPKKLVLRHLDGSQDDSFDIYVNTRYVGHYEFSGDRNEYWVTTQWQIPDPETLPSIVEFELIATDPDTAWCESGWGQVMFNWAEVQEGLIP